MMKGRTTEQLIREVNEYIEKYPHTTRNNIRVAVGINYQKLDWLNDMGLIKLPPKVKPGAHSIGWRLDARKLNRT